MYFLQWDEIMFIFCNVALRFWLHVTSHQLVRFAILKTPEGLENEFKRKRNSFPIISAYILFEKSRKYCGIYFLTFIQCASYEWNSEGFRHSLPLHFRPPTPAFFFSQILNNPAPLPEILWYLIKSYRDYFCMKVYVHTEYVFVFDSFQQVEKQTNK